MANVGYATLSVIPSLKGGGAALASQMAGPSQAAGVQAGGLFGGAFGGALGGVLAGGAAVAGIGAGLAAIGGSFDEAFDAIRVKTGATGQELAGLKDVFRNVVSEVPTDFGSAADAIGGLQQRLHLSGADLAGLSEQVLELSRITETDLGGNVDSITRAFGDWGVATQDQQATLDEFFRASQLGGQSVAELATSVTDFGSPLRQLGFGLDDSLAMFARFEAEGVNTSTVMSGMRQAVKNLGSGMATEATGVSDFGDIIAGVKDGTFDLSDAMTVFGARAGTDVFKAIQEGRFELGRFSDQITSGTDTIRGAADDTNDWRESLEVLKNRALVLIEPLATRVFNALGQGAKIVLDLVDAFGEGGLSGVSRILADRFAALSTPVKVALGALFAIISPVGAVAAAVVYAYMRFEGFRNVVDSVVQWLVGTAWPAIQSFAQSLIRSFGDAVTWVQTRWSAISEAVGHVITVVRVIVGAWIAWFKAAWHAWGDDLLNFARDVWQFISNTIRNGVDYIKGIIDLVLAVINGDWGKAWEAIKHILSAAWAQMRNIVRIAWEAVKGIIGAGLSVLKALWRAAWAGIKALLSAAWAAIKTAVRAGIDAVVGFIRSLPGRAVSALGRFASMLGNVGRGAIRGLLDGIRAVWDNVVDFFRDVPDRIVSAIGDLGRLLYDAGRAIISGLREGIENALGGLLDMVSGIGGRIADLKGPLPKDRKLLVPAGKAIMGGLDEGLREGWKGPQKFLSGIGPQIGDGEFAIGRNGAITHRVVTSGSSALKVEIDITGAPDALVRELRKHVRVNGGNVQAVIGTGV